MTRTVSAAELSLATNKTVRTIQRTGKTGDWPFLKQKIRGGTERRYIVSKLPEEYRIALAKGKVKADTSSSNATIATAASVGKKQAEQKAVHHESELVKKERQLNEFGQLLPGQQALAYSRKDVLKACEEFIIAAGITNNKKGIAEFCILYNTDEIEVSRKVKEHVAKLSASTVYRWQRVLKEAGPIGLVNGYKNPKKGSTTLTHDQQLFIIGVIKAKPHSSIVTIHMGMEARFTPAPHVSTIRRFVNKWKKENASLLLYCTNPDAWRNKHQFAIGDASEQVERLNQVWEFDSTPADVMLVDGRHCLIGVIDVYSRRLKLLVSPTSKATAVAALIRWAIIDWGMGEIAKTDNGADYVSNHIVQVFESLGIEQKLCPPFTPEAKPHIERSFKTFAHSFQELMPGYIGHSVADRKDIEARKSFAQRLGQQDSAISIKMTAEQLQQYCDRWCESIYHQNKHRGLDGRTPAEVARIWNGTEKRITDARALDILLAEAPKSGGTRVVSKEGVAVDKIIYVSDGLPQPGTTVRVKLDQTDLGTIYLFDEEGKFICIAQDPMRTGLDRAETAAKLNARQKELVRVGSKQLRKISKEQALDELHEEILEYRESKVANIIDLPKSSEEYSTPALAEASKAADALIQEKRETDEIDELLAEGDYQPNQPQYIKQIEKKGSKGNVIPIFSTSSEKYNWIKSRERKVPGLTRQEYDWLSEYYTESGGRMYLQLEGDLREKMGQRESNVAEG